jgi:Cyclin, N-terminal domain
MLTFPLNACFRPSDKQTVQTPLLTSCFWCHLQTRRRPTPCYLETVQTDVNSSMRGILVDWLVEVSHHTQRFTSVLCSIPLATQGTT